MPDEGDEVVRAARAGDEAAFAALVERHRRELRVHCYRMLGSFDEAEDLVQETFLRAWKNLGGFAGRSTMRAWLYRIATNACLDALDSRARRILPHQLTAPGQAGSEAVPRTDVAWLQPFPDRLLEPASSSAASSSVGASPGPAVASGAADGGSACPAASAGPVGPSAPEEVGPEAAAIARETIELAFLAAIQHLPPRQRAVLILRDVLGWPAKETAELLAASVPAVNSALQRARATLRNHLPPRRLDWRPSSAPTPDERAVLRRYLAAVDRADLAAVAELLAEDVRATMPPFPLWFQGRAAVVASLAASWDPARPGYIGRLRMLPTRANRQPAVGTYLRGPGDTAYRPFALGVLRIEDGLIAEVTAFHDPGLFAAFALPPVLPLAPPPVLSPPVLSPSVLPPSP